MWASIESDVELQVALAFMACHAIEFFTVEWASVAPAVVGTLLPLVNCLLRSCTLGERYGPTMSLPPPPRFLNPALLPPQLTGILYDQVDIERTGVLLTDDIYVVSTTVDIYISLQDSFPRVTDGPEGGLLLLSDGEFSTSLLCCCVARDAVFAAADVALASYRHHYNSLDWLLLTLRGLISCTANSIRRHDRDELFKLVNHAFPEGHPSFV